MDFLDRISDDEYEPAPVFEPEHVAANFDAWYNQVVEADDGEVDLVPLKPGQTTVSVYMVASTFTDPPRSLFDLYNT